MRIPSRSLGAALVVAASLVPTLRSQNVKVFGGPDPDRTAATLVMFGDNVMAGISISYSQPAWKDEYDSMMEELKGKSHRLGKNWWTSFDTTAKLQLGGTMIPPGAYYLGLHCDDEGNFSLLVFDADKAMKTGMVPFAVETWKGGMKVPKGTLEQPATKLTIKLDKNDADPMHSALRVQWGKHELSADMTIQAGMGGMKDDMHGAAEAKGSKDQGKGGDKGK